LPEDSALAAAKTQAFENIETAFMERYPKVTLTFVGKPEGFSYSSELQSRAKQNRLPNLFESTGLSDSSIGSGMIDKLTDLDGLVERMKKDFTRENDPVKCLFMDQYYQAFIEAKRLPLGFRVPVFYVNTALVQNALLKSGPIDDAVAMADTLLKNTGKYTFINTDFATKMAFQALYKGAYGTEAIPPIPDGLQLFLDDNAAAYFSDISDYPIIRAKGQCDIYPVIAEGSIPGFFSDFWSIGNCDKKQLRTVETFLCFLLTDRAQTELFYQSMRRDAFPLNSDAFVRFQNSTDSVWIDFFGVKNQNLSKYVFSMNTEG